MKKPAIIDQEIEFTIFSHAMITPPMEVEDYNPDDPAELIYASAMDFITEGRTEQGRKGLESAYRLGSWQRDANMYHKGNGVPYFPKEGSLYPHRSGVDYTFENEEQKYRASFLIRRYKYEVGGEIIKNPTYLWEDIFGYNSITGKGLTIRWVDEPEGVQSVRLQDTRINLNDGKGKADEKPWRFIKSIK